MVGDGEFEEGPLCFFLPYEGIGRFSDGYKGNVASFVFQRISFAF